MGSGLLSAFAGQVNWSSAAFSGHQSSDGISLDDSFVFELGAFADGFVPSAGNVEEWASHWRAAQRTAYNPETQFFAASFVVETNEPPFSADAQGYFWGRSLDRPGEWFLATDASWTWPLAGGADPPVTWTARTAAMVIVGEVNPDGDPFLLRMEAVDPTLSAALVNGEAWQALRFSEAQIVAGVGAWTEDPDGDGRSNLTEMGLGSDPLEADAASWPQVTVTPRNTLELSLDKVPSHLLDYLVEVSGDLVNWQSGEAHVEVITDSATRLVVRDRIPLTGLHRRFIRLTFVLVE
jgi:hypothetical protein